jgi:hypothetical protein
MVRIEEGYRLLSPQQPEGEVRDLALSANLIRQQARLG